MVSRQQPSIPSTDTTRPMAVHSMWRSVRTCCPLTPVQNIGSLGPGQVDPNSNHQGTWLVMKEFAGRIRLHSYDHRLSALSHKCFPVRVGSFVPNPLPSGSARMGVTPS